MSQLDDDIAAIQGSGNKPAPKNSQTSKPMTQLDADIAAINSPEGKALAARNEGIARMKAAQQDPDRLGAASHGFFGGLVAGAPGAPMNILSSALDLAKMPFGYSISEFKKGVNNSPMLSKLVGKFADVAPPEWAQPFDNSKVIGTSDWIMKRYNDSGLGAPLNNPSPDDPMSRVLYGTGYGVGASASPAGRAQFAKNVLSNGVASGAGSLVREIAPDSPAAQITASMLPASGARGARTVATKLSGVNQVQTARRLQQLKDAGIANPSVGLATGSSLIQGVENLLSKVPGSVGPFQKANAANFQGMQDKVAALRDMASQDYGRTVAGSGIQSNLTKAPSPPPGTTAPPLTAPPLTAAPLTAAPLTAAPTNLPDKVSYSYENLLNRVTDKVGAQTPINIDASQNSARGMSTPTQGAEATSSILINPRMKAIAQALQADSSPTPAVYAPGSVMGHYQLSPELPAPGMPFSTVKDLRTRVGAELGSKDIIGTPLQGEYSQLYGALSKDMRNAAVKADANTMLGNITDSILNGTPAPPQSIGATGAWDRSNNYYTAASNRMEKLQPYVNATPEGAYRMAMNAAGNAGSTSTLQSLRHSLTPDTRATIAATLLDSIGDANAGNQDATGKAFSPKTYLTNWNKLDSTARDSLLSGFPNDTNVKAGAGAVAQGASLLNDASKVWANPSGTGGNLEAAGTLGGIGANAISHPYIAAGTLGALGLARALSSKVMLNPNVVEGMAAPADPAALAAAQQSQAQNAAINAIMAKFLIQQPEDGQ